MSRHSFSTLDFVIFGLSLVLSCAVGLFYAIKSMRASAQSGGGSHEDHLLGGRSMPLLPTALSLMSSVVSGILILAYPAEIYRLGLAVCWLMVGCVCALLISAVFVVPIIHRSVRGVSAYRYFQERFESRAIRVYASLLFTITTLVYMSVVLYAPAVAMAAVTDIPVWALVVVVGVLCTAYTSVGGLRAVVWTDTIQSLIMYGGLMAMVTMATFRVGSVQEVWRINREKGRLAGGLNIDPNPLQYMTVWTAGLGGTLFWLNVWSVNQMALQRYIAMPRLKDARTLVLLTIPAILLISALAYYMGLAMFAYYDSRGCDPLASGQVQRGDQLVMYFMIELFSRYPGLPGLFLACLFSGTLSTVSSGVNSLSAVGWEEFLLPLLQWRAGRALKRAGGYQAVAERAPVPDKVATICTRLIGIGYGAVAIGLAFLCEPLGGIFQAVNGTLTAIGGPLTALMILGIFFPCANGIGSLVGMVVGTGVSVWLFVGALLYPQPKPYLPVSTWNCSSLPSALPLPPTLPPAAESRGFVFTDLYGMSVFMYPVVGVVVTTLTALLVSLATGRSRVPKRRPELVWNWRKTPPQPTTNGWPRA